MNRIVAGRVVAFALFVLCTAAAFSQELRIVSSSGRAEILIPGEGWRQAVSGRAVPVGSALSIWTDGEVAIGREGLTIVGGPLSVVVVNSTDDASVSMRLIAGELAVEAASAVIIASPIAEIATRAASFSLTATTLVVASGTVTVRYADGSERSVPAPATLSLEPTPSRPIVPSYSR